MSEIYVVGGSDFTLGFYLTGIRNIVNVVEKKDVERTFLKLSSNTNIGIIITDNITVSKLPTVLKKKVENSVKPITVVLSEDDSSQDNLRDMVKRSIGVDLWKKK
ncbi:V-type ATP synthase subunit F [archaeon]|jgi:V/A-type H+/Na+-transporting ATPase subunit F|nr:V-type ATP synthase subunit F [archaeon]MBT4351603.1 V-type ATP synthase subunit F [archaeon]MBT4648360.1 V-type ATP synthase subunit F [archaeon]MBT6821573.1 V-type ATP synthase subunit F [archaeon]MBT7391597.1 V-type ATP synthase subunit F [archaeon]